MDPNYFIQIKLVFVLGYYNYLAYVCCKQFWFWRFVIGHFILSFLLFEELYPNPWGNYIFIVIRSWIVLNTLPLFADHSLPHLHLSRQIATTFSLQFSLFLVILLCNSLLSRAKLYF